MSDDIHEQTADLRCESCAFATSNVRAAMRHAGDTGHQVTGPGPMEGTVITVSLAVDP